MLLVSVFPKPDLSGMDSYVQSSMETKVITILQTFIIFLNDFI